MITQDYLKQILYYNPETGILTWKIARSNRIKVGQQVTCKGKHGYPVVNIDRKLYLIHRLAWFYMTDRWPEHQIDHINGIKDDNRWCNLREATNAQNQHNRGKHKDNKSGFKGVFWDNQYQKWMAAININNKRIFLGRFDDKDNAASAYDKAALTYHGEYH